MCGGESDRAFKIPNTVVHFHLLKKGYFLFLEDAFPFYEIL